VRHWTIVGLIVVLAGLFGATGRAVAQQPVPPVPPEHYTLDPRGVDLVTGIFNHSSTDVVIGQPGAGGLSHARQNLQFGWTDSVQGSLRGAGSSVVTVIYGVESEVFTLSGGVYTPVSAQGATLTQSGTDYIYTTASGAVVKYTTNYCYTTTGGSCTTSAYLYEVTDPTGEKTTYTYTTQNYLRSVDSNGNPVTGTAVRLTSIANNRGYMLRYVYQKDTIAGAGGSATLTSRVLAWMTIASVTGVNTAVDYCDPASTSCTYSRTWPSATYGYPASGDQTVTDQSGRTTTYLYNGLYGAPVGIQYPGSTSNDVTITYTGSGGSTRLSTVTDATGTWSYSYSDAGSTRTMTVTGPMGQVLTAVSDQSIGRATSVTQTTTAGASPVTRTWAYHYDGQRRLDQITNPEGDYTVLAYDARGNVTSTTAVAKPGSGLANIVTSATYPSTCSTPVTCNKPLTTTDARGNVTDYVWNGTHGGLESVTAPLPNPSATVRPQTRISYAAQTAYYKNSSGVIVAAPSSITLPVSTSACATNAAPGCVGTIDEVKATVAYGSSGVANNLLPTLTTRGDGGGTLSVTTAVTYDPNGDVLTVDGPLAGTGDTIRYRYDAARQRVGVVGPDPDAGGGLLNRAQRMTYNARGQLTLTEVGMTPGYSDTDWTSFSVLQKQATEYDSWGRPAVSRSQDASGNTLALQQVGYDAAGRAQCAATRMNPGAFSSFPATSACSLGTTGGYGPDRIIQMTYDAADRPISTVSGVGTASTITESVTYTANGQTATLTDGNGALSAINYDGFDRRSGLYYPNPSSPGAINLADYEGYGYDVAGNVITYRNRAGDTFGMSYDNLNRRITLGGSAVADRTFSYDNLNRPITTAFTSGGPSSTNGWDALSRLTSQTQSPLGTVSYGYDAAGRRVWTGWPDGFWVAYDWSYANDLMTIRENGATTWALAAYGYDNLGRRITEARNNGVISGFGYDGISRLSGMTHDLPGSSQDISWGYSYNPAGQIVSRSVSNNAYVYTPASTAIAYVNNLLNRLTSINGSAVGYDGRGNITSAPGATYGYNAENQMTSASTGAGSSGYAFDPTGRLYQAVGGTNRRFLYDGQQVIAEYDGSGVIQNRYVPGLGLNDVVTSYDSGANRTWLLSDERQSVVGLTNASGAATSINTYDEYGVPGASNAGRFQYTGQMWLPDAQLYHYRARAYAPQIGRFMQTDPLGYAAGMNVYGYVSADPVNFVDPLGLMLMRAYACGRTWVGVPRDMPNQANTGNYIPLSCAVGTSNNQPNYRERERGSDGVTRTCLAPEPDSAIGKATNAGGYASDGLSDLAGGILKASGQGAAAEIATGRLGILGKGLGAVQQINQAFMSNNAGRPADIAAVSGIARFVGSVAGGDAGATWAFGAVMAVGIGAATIVGAPVVGALGVGIAVTAVVAGVAGGAAGAYYGEALGGMVGDAYAEIRGYTGCEE